jgi:hypothetical protein
MFLTALILAAGVAYGSTQPLATEARPPATERMPNLFHEPARCGATHDEVARRIATATRGRVRPEYAVMRQVDGCGLRSPVGYHPDYLLPGHADAPRYRPVNGLELAPGGVDP